MKRLILFLLCIGVAGVVFSKTKPAGPRAFTPFAITAGISPNVSDAGFFYGNLNFSWLVHNSIELQASTGYPFHYSLGANFHPNANFSARSISPYVGMAAGQFQQAINVNVPIGVSFVARSGFTASIGLCNYFFLSNQHEKLNPFESFLDVRVGWSF